MLVQQVDRARPVGVPAGVVRDEPDASAAQDRGIVGEEDVDAEADRTGRVDGRGRTGAGLGGCDGDVL